MALVICIVLIALVAFAMYDHISPQLPKEWRMNKATSAHVGGAAESGDTDPASPASSSFISSSRWLVASDGTNSRVVRALSTPIRGGDRIYDAPVMYLSCYQGKLFAWLDTRLRAASLAQDPGRVQVQLNSLAPELWVRQDGQNIATTHPLEVLALVSKEEPLQFRLAFGEAPAQVLTLQTAGFDTVAAALAPCRD
jgi:hypothetical protein